MCPMSQLTTLTFEEVANPFPHLVREPPAACTSSQQAWLLLPSPCPGELVQSCVICVHVNGCSRTECLSKGRGFQEEGGHLPAWPLATLA